VCVDRDDDLGRKAKVPGPVFGRASVLDAAMRLGTADPEDADTNALFASIRLLDEIRESGEEAEVVVLTGSPKVGVVSDRRVAEQFDRVLREHPAEAAYLVSDGAEDEYLFPILASRVRIDGVTRVYIRQSASLESTYYTLVRALKDPKLRAKTVLPFALVMLTLGLAAAGGVIWWGVIGLLILLGIYLIFWTFDIDEALIESIRSASTDVRQGSVAFGFGLFALALVGLGFLWGTTSTSATRATRRSTASSCSCRRRSSCGSSRGSSGNPVGRSGGTFATAGSPAPSSSARRRSSGSASSPTASCTPSSTSRGSSSRPPSRSWSA
jgi:putative membrane protein